MSEKKYKKALNGYNKAISMNKNDEDSLYGRALLKYETKDFIGVIQDTNRLVRFNKENPEYNAGVFHLRGMARYKIGQNDLACSDLKKAASFNFQEAQNYLANQGFWCRNMMD